MGENSAIEWTDHTWNPWIGCTHVSEGCRNCYAETMMDKRYRKVEWGPGKPRVRTSDANWRTPLAWNRKAEKAGVRYRVFCASLADVFDAEVPVEWRADLFNLIGVCRNLDWLLLTKRPENAFSYMRDAPPNVLLGVSVEDQKTADERIPVLLQIPAAVRFLSVEPLLGPVDLSFHLGLATNHDDLRGLISWAIVGGESGPNARPMHPEWARSLRDQCVAAGTAFFVKQMGGTRDKRGALEDLPEDLRIREFPHVNS